MKTRGAWLPKRGRRESAIIGLEGLGAPPGASLSGWVCSYGADRGLFGLPSRVAQGSIEIDVSHCPLELYWMRSAPETLA